MLATATGQTINIGRKTYSVEAKRFRDGKHFYELTGVRGAKYYTMPYRRMPGLHYLVSRTMQIDPLGGVVLTDTTGKLRVV
jgi:hypothetical protein